MTAPYPDSPVPSDDELEPGELPFTAFGQWGPGNMDNRVFDQDIYWVNIAGEAFLLVDMDETYRHNVIGFLLDNAEYFHVHAALREVSEAVHSILGGHVPGSVLASELGGAATSSMEPQQWLEATPLMRKLRALTPDSSR